MPKALEKSQIRWIRRQKSEVGKPGVIEIDVPEPDFRSRVRCDCVLFDDDRNGVGFQFLSSNRFEFQMSISCLNCGLNDGATSFYRTLIRSTNWSRDSDSERDYKSTIVGWIRSRKVWIGLPMLYRPEIIEVHELTPVLTQPNWIRNWMLAEIFGDIFSFQLNS